MGHYPREREFWTPPPTYEGRTVFCLASGPSIASVDVERLRGQAVFVVNSSCKLAPWADVLYFMDTDWFENHRKIVMEWQGLVVTSDRRVKGMEPDKINRIDILHMDHFTQGQYTLRAGRSSGHMAVSLAVSMRARRVVMLGYDMKHDATGRSHFHDEYRNSDPKMYAQEFVPSFNNWRRKAYDVGCEIVNATVGSAVTEFPFVELDAILAEG